MKRARTTVVLACAVFVAACESPEATRTRGGGPGADPGNRPAQVKMHEGSYQYWETPVLIPAEHPPLEPAQQARELSLERDSQPSSSSNSEQAPSAGAGRGQ